LSGRRAQDRPERRPRWPTHVLRAVGWTIGALIALPLLLIAAVLVLLNTDFGRTQLAQYLPGLTGGMVHVAGIGGRFPDRIRIASITLHDNGGTWLTVDNLALDWSPLELFKGRAHIERLAADAVDLPRMPAPSAPARQPATASSGSVSLPVQVDVDAISVARFAIGAPVATVPAVVSVAGDAHATSLTNATAHVALKRLDGEGTYDLDAAIKAATIDASLRVHEPPGGLIGGVAGLKPVGAITVDASVVGPRDALATKLAVDLGPFHATANGVVNTTGNRADLRVDATAPQMELLPGLGWRSVELRADVRGAFDTPDATGTLTVTGLRAFGVGAETISAGITGNRGDVTLLANVFGLRIAVGPSRTRRAKPA
jgi:translocation and assembly module TamB